MKLTSVKLTSPNTLEPIVLSFRDPSNANPYQVKSIQGLDADDISKRYYGAQVGGAGTRYYDLTIKKRNIIANIGLSPRWALDETYSDLRDDLYRLISSTRNGEITIQFLNGLTVVAEVNGTVSKMEASHFDNLPDVKLTVDCPDPLLRAPEKVIVPVEGLDITDTTITDSLSTAPHGFNLEAKFLANVSTFSIATADWMFKVDYTYLTNDIIHIYYDVGYKAIWLTRGETTIQIADRILANYSVWPIIFPGENNFVLSASTEWTGIEYTPTYWGV